MPRRLTIHHWLDDRMPGHTPIQRVDDAQRLGELEPCACALVPAATPAHVYNEEAFRYFLEIERKRSELSNRPFLLLLLDLKKRDSASDIDATTADRLFGALSTCLRDTDFIGWYRARAVVGAVLTQHADGLGVEAQEAVRRRVVDVVAQRVSRQIVERVQVRVYQASPSAQV
jgi:hypothetical protein